MSKLLSTLDSNCKERGYSWLVGCGGSCPVGMYECRIVLVGQQARVYRGVSMAEAVKVAIEAEGFE